MSTKQSFAPNAEALCRTMQPIRRQAAGAIIQALIKAASETITIKVITIRTIKAIKTIIKAITWSCLY